MLPVILAIQLAAAEPCLRTRDAVAVTVVTAALSRSETVRALCRELADTDLRVYVSTTSHNCKGRPTTTLFAVGSGVRYLSISLPLTTCRSLTTPASPVGVTGNIAWLGHELRHALEIGAEPAVRDQAAMARLFKHIGRPAAGKGETYETAAAIETQRLVASEVK